LQDIAEHPGNRHAMNPAGDLDYCPLFFINSFLQNAARSCEVRKRSVSTPSRFSASR